MPGGRPRRTAPVNPEPVAASPPPAPSPSAALPPVATRSGRRTVPTAAALSTATATATTRRGRSQIVAPAESAPSSPSRSDSPESNHSRAASPPARAVPIALPQSLTTFVAAPASNESVAVHARSVASVPAEPAHEASEQSVVEMNDADAPDMLLDQTHPINASRFPMKGPLLLRLEAEIEALQSGAHIVYAQRVQQLRDEAKVHAADVENEKQIRIQNIIKLYDAELEQIRHQLQADEEEAKDCIMDELRRKKKHVDVFGALPGAADSFTMTRGKRAKIASGMDERTAKAKRPLPTVKKSVYNHLSNHEIKTDLHAIKSQLPNYGTAPGKPFGGRVKAYAHDIFVERGMLNHFDTEVHRGDVIDVQDDSGQIESVLITSISHAEILGQFDDTSEFRTTLSQLRSGKVVIVDVHARPQEL